MSHWDKAAVTLGGARRAAWDEPLDVYDARAAECADVIVRLLGNVRGEGTWSYMVDLGCGPGRLLVAVRGLRRFWSIAGVDSSPAMVEWARQVIEPPGEVYVGDVTALPDEWSGLFHAAWSVAVLQHLDPAGQERAVGEVGRILRRGGRAVLQVVEGRSHDGPLSHDTDAADLRSWAAAAGLAVVGESRGLVQPGWLWVTLERR